MAIIHPRAARKMYIHIDTHTAVLISNQTAFGEATTQLELNQNPSYLFISTSLGMATFNGHFIENCIIEMHEAFFL